MKATDQVEDVFAPSRDAVLTPEQLARALQISIRQLQRLNLPSVSVGKRPIRYVYGFVLDELTKRSK